MKSIIFRVLSYSLLLVLCCSCDNAKVEQPLFSLDKTEIFFEPSGGQINITLNANSDWTTDNIPDWISLNHTSGNSGGEVTVTAEANEDAEERNGKIIFANNHESITLNISQEAKKRELEWSPLAFSSFENVDFVLGENNTERIYRFTTRQMFVNPDVNPEMNKKIFLGNLVNRRLNDNTDIVEYTNYTFNPITVVPLTVTEHSKTLIPSKAEQDAFAAKILEKKPTQNERFFNDGIGVEYNSHRELSLIGRGNMGINLDEVVSGKSYKVQEMVKKNGIIYSFSHTLFTLTMDLHEHIVKEVIDKNNFPDNSLSYISSVSYGRIGLLIIESDYSFAKIRPVVNKILRNNSDRLSGDEIAILNDINAYHLYFDSSQTMKITKGKADVIEAYRAQITNDIFNVFPFKFIVSDYFEHGNAEMTFQITGIPN